jgi:hypothetical protein
VPQPTLLLRAAPAALLLLQAPVELAPVAPPLEGGRIEHFALEEEAPGGPRLVGLCELLRLERGRELVLQQDLRFVAGPRVVHVELRDARGTRLVWREVDSRGGRTLLAEWAAGERTLGLAWRGLDGRTRGSWLPCASAVLPLTLVELARAGRAVSGRVERLDPLAGGLEPVGLRTRYALLARGPSGARVERTLELSRADGTSAGCFIFEGARLMRFQLQSGGPWARRISPEEHARLLEEVQEAAPTEG